MTAESEQPMKNTDTELFREIPEDAMSNSLHKTADGRIGINVGGYVFVKPLTEWHRLAEEDRLRAVAPSQDADS